jgi:hypothetical protein
VQTDQTQTVKYFSWRHSCRKRTNGVSFRALRNFAGTIFGQSVIRSIKGCSFRPNIRDTLLNTYKSSQPGVVKQSELLIAK